MVQLAQMLLQLARRCLECVAHIQQPHAPVQVLANHLPCGGGGGRRIVVMMMMEEDEGASSKKRRLGVDQVRFLESSFKEEKKLEPERKVKIAQQLGLQPRQVAIWFQNRRARSRSKQLERDYIVLKSLYDVATLEKQKLQDEVLFSFLINLILVFYTKCTLEVLQRP